MKGRLWEGTVTRIDTDSFEAKLTLLRPSSFPGEHEWYAVIDKARVPPKYIELLKLGAVFYLNRRGLCFRRLRWTRRQVALVRRDVSLLRPKWKTKRPPRWEEQWARAYQWYESVESALVSTSTTSTS